MASDVDYDNDHQSKIYAFELIELFAGALSALNAHKPIPKEWLDKILKEIKPQKTGKPRDSSIQNRNKEIAKEFLEKKIEIEGGKSSEQMKTVISDLEKKYNVKNINRIYAENEVEAKADILTDRLNKNDALEHEKRVLRAKKYQEKIESGADIFEISDDPEVTGEEILAAINSKKEIQVLPPSPHLTDYEKARAWMSDGMNRGICRNSDYRVFYDLPKDIKDVISKKK
ncbi:MAG: hypothetical protein AUJ12_09265 [Alphaproteobacteria bacterium CG1_02_46_17]|nr:MAG: hypothetical protein AUJ12_09265 [Alphaproteobacteria bacterium CG1_02_46_17]